MATAASEQTAVADPLLVNRTELRGLLRYTKEQLRELEEAGLLVELPIRCRRRIVLDRTLDRITKAGKASRGK